MQENKSFKGFSKETMTLFILAVPLTLHPRDVQQALVPCWHMDCFRCIKHVLPFLQTQHRHLCFGCHVKICRIDINFTEELIIQIMFQCTWPWLLSPWYRGTIPSSSSHSCCLALPLAPTFTSWDHLYLFYTLVAVGSLQVGLASQPLKRDRTVFMGSSLQLDFNFWRLVGSQDVLFEGKW